MLIAGCCCYPKLRFDDGRKLSVNLSELKNVDYGYCSTSHAAQGATVDRMIVNANSKAGEVLVNAAQFYVSTSRARDDVLVVTDSIKGLQRASRETRRRKRRWRPSKLRALY